MAEVRSIWHQGALDSRPPPWLPAGTATVRLLFSPAAQEPASVEEVAAAEAEARLAEAVARAEAQARERVESEGKARWDRAVEQLDRVLSDLLDIRRQLFGTMEQEMMHLALCVARAVVARELTSDPQYVLRLVREAVGMIVDEDRVEISVSAADYDLVFERLADISRDNPRAGTLLIKADQSIEAGCIVETKLARIDATVASRLRNVAESLLGEL